MPMFCWGFSEGSAKWSALVRPVLLAALVVAVLPLTGCGEDDTAAPAAAVAAAVQAVDGEEDSSESDSADETDAGEEADDEAAEVEADGEAVDETEGEAASSSDKAADESEAEATAESDAALDEGDAAAEADEEEADAEGGEEAEEAEDAEAEASEEAEAAEESEQAAEDEEPADPMAKEVAVALRDAQLQQIAEFYMRELGKPVIPHESIKNTRVTIIAEKKLPLREALEIIGNALRQKGVMVLEGPRQIELLPIAEARRVNRRIVPAGESVADVPDQSEIVDKVFELEHYDVTRLKDLILPTLPDYAFIMADPNVNRLIVTDAAANLLRIEEMVAKVDVPRANQTVERIFAIEHGDASEIVSMLRMIIAGTLGDNAKQAFAGGPAPRSGGGEERGNGPPGMRGGGGPGGSSAGAEAGSNVVFVERSESPIILRADLSRNWIFAVASPDVMAQIERWVKEFDEPKAREEPYVLFDIKHADISELANQITQAINAMPDADVRDSVRVIPFTKSRQLLVYGSQRGRDLVQTLLKQLDVETSQYQVIEEVALRYGSAEAVKQKIEDLFGKKDDQSSNRYWWSGRSQTQQQDELNVTADTQRNTVTIRTDPVKMERIKKLIAEQWDQPINLDEVKPRVYTLRYTDPLLMKTLLENMFTREQTRSSFSWWSYSQSTESTTSVGRLFGQFSFEAMRDSDKLIVSAKSPENYVVIDELIAQIDRPQEAGLPVVVELKHANAEDVAEQLNAMFSEAGTPAQVRRTERGLSRELRESGGRAASEEPQNRNQNQNQRQALAGQDPTMMQFWWSQSRPAANEQPTSNLIGKPRVVPINRRNAVMIMSPAAYGGQILDLVQELDRPGPQVVIHAIIAEIQHDDESTLGVRIASDPSVFNDSRLADQSIGGTLRSTFTDTFANGNGVINSAVNLNALIQFLVREVDLKIMNEPRVYTADNEEAHFFDGQDVPVLVSDLTAAEADGTITRAFDYQAVGTRLHVRPHITQTGDIALVVNLELSRIETGETVFGNFIFNRRETTTHVTLEDGQTVVISGMVRKEAFEDIRKLPLLGDLPLVGGLFRNTDVGVRNREVIAFITPRIIVPVNGETREMSEENEAWLQRLRESMTTDEGLPELLDDSPLAPPEEPEEPEAPDVPDEVDAVDDDAPPAAPDAPLYYENAL